MHTVSLSSESATEKASDSSPEELSSSESEKAGDPAEAPDNEALQKRFARLQEDPRGSRELSAVGDNGKDKKKSPTEGKVASREGPQRSNELQEKSAVGDKNKRVRLRSRGSNDLQEKSAVGDQNRTAQLLLELFEKEDQGKHEGARPDEHKDTASQVRLNLSQLGWLRDISVFQPGSKLWRVIETRSRLGPETEIVARGEKVFCDFCFDDVQTEAKQKRHFSFWTNHIKEYLADLPPL